MSSPGHLREGISSVHSAGAGWFRCSTLAAVAVHASVLRCPTPCSWDPGFAKWGEFFLLGNGLLYPPVSCSMRGSGPGRVMGFADLDEGIVGVLLLFFGLV